MKRDRGKNDKDDDEQQQRINWNSIQLCSSIVGDIE